MVPFTRNTGTRMAGAKIGGLAAVALIAATMTASAADPRGAPAYAPAPTAYNWSGIYLGINGGWGWGESSVADDAVTYDTDGGLVGGTLGINAQSGMWVGGVEGDFDWAKIDGTDGGGCAIVGFCTTSIDWLATARLRAGVAFGNFLVFGTGGAAFGSVNGTIGIPTTQSDREIHVGWTAGAGVEAALSRNISVKAEWLYYDLGGKDHTFPSGGVLDFQDTGNLVRLGLNWRM